MGLLTTLRKFGILHVGAGDYYTGDLNTKKPTGKSGATNTGTLGRIVFWVIATIFTLLSLAGGMLSLLFSLAVWVGVYVLFVRSKALGAPGLSGVLVGAGVVSFVGTALFMPSVIIENAESVAPYLAGATEHVFDTPYFNEEVEWFDAPGSVQVTGGWASPVKDVSLELLGRIEAELIAAGFARDTVQDGTVMGGIGVRGFAATDGSIGCTLGSALYETGAEGPTGLMVHCFDLAPDGEGSEDAEGTMTPVSVSEDGVILVEGEDGVLVQSGSYSRLDPTTRGGEAYLGDGGATAEYTFEVPTAGSYLLSVRVSDDAVHESGKRDATITVGDVSLPYTHISTDTNGWAWQDVGTVELQSGPLTVSISKDRTTSAAFVMDAFKLAPQ